MRSRPFVQRYQDKLTMRRRKRCLPCMHWFPPPTRATRFQCETGRKKTAWNKSRSGIYEAMDDCKIERETAFANSSGTMTEKSLRSMIPSTNRPSTCLTLLPFVLKSMVKATLPDGLPSQPARKTGQATVKNSTPTNRFFCRWFVCVFGMSFFFYLFPIHATSSTVNVGKAATIN